MCAIRAVSCLEDASYYAVSFKYCFNPSCIASSIAYAQAVRLLPYQEVSLPLDKHVDDLVSRMTLEEKISQMTNDSAAILQSSRAVSNHLRRTRRERQNHTSESDAAIQSQRRCRCRRRWAVAACREYLGMTGLC